MGFSYWVPPFSGNTHVDKDKCPMDSLRIGGHVSPDPKWVFLIFQVSRAKMLPNAWLIEFFHQKLNVTLPTDP